MSEKKLEVGLVGCGRVSRTAHYDSIKNNPSLDFRAVCDTDRERADIWADKNEVKAYYDFADMLAGEELDLVSINVPNRLHPELGIKAAEQGVHVICEKPLGIRLAEVDELITGLRHFGHRRHDVVVLEVLDPAELDFPFQRFSRFQGFEQLGNLLADPAAIRTSYLKEMEESRNKVKQEIRKLGMELVSVRTDTPFDVAMREFLEARENRATMG